MKPDTATFLSILFNPGEHIYASPDKYTSSWDDEKKLWKTYRPSIEQGAIAEDQTQLVAINPLRGDVRNDDNVTAFRTFLLEIDDLPLVDQKRVIKASGMPYSMCVFSGGKSLHYAITLDTDLPNIQLYKYYAEWLLATIPEADSSTKNPSRSIRFPGFLRKETGKTQKLVEAKGRVSFYAFTDYLSKHQDKMPKVQTKVWDPEVGSVANDTAGMALWVKRGLQEGFSFDAGRNNGWFSVGYEFGKCSFDFETALAIAESVFTPENSFTRREWLSCMTSGYKKAIKDRKGR